MKRSDMELIIAKEIATHFGHNPQNLVAAQFILKRLLESGMLPPTTELNKLSLIDNAWEPEDET